MVQFPIKAVRDIVRELSVTTEICAQFPLVTSSEPSCPRSWTTIKNQPETGSSVCALITLIPAQISLMIQLPAVTFLEFNKHKRLNSIHKTKNAQQSPLAMSTTFTFCWGSSLHISSITSTFLAPTPWTLSTIYLQSLQRKWNSSGSLLQTEQPYSSSEIIRERPQFKGSILPSKSWALHCPYWYNFSS